METYIVTVDGTAYEVTVQKKSQLQPECTPQAAPAHPQTKESKIAPAPAAAVDENALKVTSGTSGKIWKVVAAAGDTVKRGDTLVILEAMKMEIPVVAPEDGQVLSDLQQFTASGSLFRYDARQFYHDFGRALLPVSCHRTRI